MWTHIQYMRLLTLERGCFKYLHITLLDRQTGRQENERDSDQTRVSGDTAGRQDKNVTE